MVRHQIRRNGVHLVAGTARFVDSQPGGKIKLAVLLTETDPDGERLKGIYKHRDASLPKTVLTCDKVMVACGTRPVRSEGVVYDGRRVFDSDQLLWGGIDRVPRSFIVIGAGVIGIEYASMINVLPGTNVTIIDPRSQLLGFADGEVGGSVGSCLPACLGGSGLLPFFPSHPSLALSIYRCVYGYGGRWWTP